MSSPTSAIPLCHPNNFRWDPETKELVKVPDVNRDTIEVLPEALEILKSIKEPVAVVSIAGPARSGKSYILSQLQDGVEFELGHTMMSQTTGIWMATKPNICSTSDGTNVRLILLDTEGIGAASSQDDQANERFDNQTFTLTALISSLLIYNSQGVPNASDLEKLNFIAKLSESIHTQLQTGETDTQAVAAFRRYSPDFFWLVRDLLLQPTNKAGQKCDIKTYLDENVLRQEDENSCSEVQSKKNTVRKNIREIFPSFDAYGLPLPSVDPEVVQNITDPQFKEDISKRFLREVKTVISNIMKKVKPKRVTGMSFINGAQLGELINMYVGALNEKGGVPEWATAWENAVKITNERSLSMAVEAYRNKIQLLSNEMPCSSIFLQDAHENALQAAKDMFLEETRMNTDAKLLEGYTLKMMKACAEFDCHTNLCCGGVLYEFSSQNDKLSESFCTTLIQNLQSTHFEPLLSNITAKSSFEELLNSIDTIKQLYDEQARGPCAKLIQERYATIIQDRLKQAANEIEKMKDYDEKVNHEMQERMKTESALDAKAEENKILEQSIAMVDAQHKQQMLMMQEQQKKADAEAERLREEYRRDKSNMEKVVQNMGEAHAKEIERVMQAQQEQQEQIQKQREIDRKAAEERAEAHRLAIEKLAEEHRQAMIQQQQEHQAAIARMPRRRRRRRLF